MRVVRWAALALLLFVAPLWAQSYPSPRDPYINDFGNLLGPTVEARLRAQMLALFEETDIEFTIVTMERMSTYRHYGEIEPFATGLFNTWGVGDADWNDGVMLLVVQRDRQMRIELGAGYSRADNRVVQRIIDEVVLPQFRSGNYEAGIERGAVRLLTDLREIRPERKTGVLAWARRSLEHLGYWLLGVVGAISAAGAWVARQAARHRPRYCPKDGSKMTRLDEVTDNQHLQAGQVMEEDIGSVDHDVWCCGQCGHTVRESYQGWFSRYGACRSCGHRTLHGSSHVVTEATTSSSGLRRTDYTCQYCGNAYSSTETIPRRSESRSSGSGSGSFGGGRSSGGGASGRW